MSQTSDPLDVAVRQLRTLDPLDVVIALTTRLALAIDRLRKLADACAGCGGTGETHVEYDAHTMTDDPRILVGAFGYQRRARLKKYGSRVERQPRGVAVLRTKCAMCADIRETVRICEAAE